MAREADFAEIEIGVYCPPLRKGGKQMTAASLKRKLRGFPTGNLSILVTGR